MQKISLHIGLYELTETFLPEVVFQLRCNLSIEEDPLEKIPKEERGSVKEAEVNYV